MTRLALGCHVFAGGFTMGVRAHPAFDVRAQFEIHDLGVETVERAQGLDFIQCQNWETWLEWSQYYEGVEFMFGNPRCTGFSCVTAGCGDEAHGAWSAPTRDVHDFCNFGVRAGIPIMCWESVQQAVTVGRELLDYLRDEIFVPAGYRIAHVLCNGGSFGNAQHRKRYFFVAYRDDGRQFNVAAPVIPEQHVTVGDVLLTDEIKSHWPNAHPARFNRRFEEYSPDTYHQPGASGQKILPHLPPGWGLNTMAKRAYGIMERYCPEWADKWDLRTSDMPFSMHCLTRLNRDGYCPVLSGSCFRYVHPILDRCCTIRELSLLMGWPEGLTPLGPHPFGQIGKGIIPDVGTWLAEMARMYLDGEWGDEDWESSYDDKRGVWTGQRFTGDAIKPPEKTFNLTRYCPEKPVNRSEL